MCAQISSDIEDTPEQAKAKGYEVIEPPTNLRSKVKPLKGADAQIDPIKRAEMAMKQLSVNFNLWLEDLVKALDDAWALSGADRSNDELYAALFRASHDLKGQAATFGHVMAGEAAGCLCDLLENTASDEAPASLIIAHINAIKAIIREDKKAGSTLARTLVLELRNAAQPFVDKP